MQTLDTSTKTAVRTLPNYIGGEWVPSESGESLPVTNPATVKPGDEMTVRVLFKGQPLTTNVYATYDGFSKEENTYAYYTEGHKDGTAKVKITQPGIWMVRVQHTTPEHTGDYDFILYDTPPSFGFHTVSVLAATDFIVIPVQMSGYAIKGLKETLRTVHEARERLNPRLRVLGLLPTFVVARTRFSREMLEGLRAIPNVRVFETVVKTTVRLQESALAGEPITAYSSSSEAASAYRAAADEVMHAVIAEGEGG